MDATQKHAAIVAYLEGALEFAEQIDDATTAYLIERALDEARDKQFSNMPPVGEIH
jgi:hypothetical protein